jgi:DNA repair protein RadC
MDIYLDTCSLHRPLDDRTQLRIQLEAEAVLSIITLCQQGKHALISSEVIAFESRRNPNPQAREIIAEILAHATTAISITDAIKDRAISFEANGFGGMDALHLA